MFLRQTNVSFRQACESRPYSGFLFFQQPPDRSASDAKPPRNLRFAGNRSLTEAALPGAVGGRPSRVPCRRACAKPTRTRPRIMSRSNSANTESSIAIARPAGVVRSNASVTETKPAPSAVSSRNVDTRSATDRPHRSNRQTRTTSMSRSFAGDRARAHFLTLFDHRPATLQSVLPQRPKPQGQRLLFERRDARIQPGPQHSRRFA